MELSESTRSKLAIRFAVNLLLVLVGIAALSAGAWRLSNLSAARQRAKWKESALRQLAGLTLTNARVGSNHDELGDSHEWVHDRILLMTNGEHIIYAYRHGRNDGSVDHLFLGHGSDGRWLYSTYHFCNSMNMIMNDDPPGSITEFANTYFAREFDGKSDECLKHTWPSK